MTGTRYNFTGSAPMTNTIGIVDVALLAASAEFIAPSHSITSSARG